MRRLILAMTLLLAACATPTPVREPEAQPIPPSNEVAHNHNSIVGMTPNELVQHFGSPRLQVRDGDGTKFQWIADNCVLDAYIYPAESGQGVSRVTYAEARSRAGNPTSVNNCAAIIEAH